MANDLWAADSGGTVRELGSLYAADASGALQRLTRLWAADSGGTLQDVFHAAPEVDFCSASTDGEAEMTVSWDAGFACESVVIDLSSTAGGSASSTEDTSPNTTGYSKTFTGLSTGPYDVDVRPFWGDSGTDREGDTCQTTGQVQPGPV